MPPAILTGSYAYGTPTEKSDIDLVVLVNEPTWRLLRTQADRSGDSDADNGDSLSFGKLNLLCVWDERDFAVWARGTAELIARKPVTRAQAVEHFDRLRTEERARRYAASMEV